MKTHLLMDLEKHEMSFRIESETEDRVLTIRLCEVTQKTVDKFLLEWLWRNFHRFLKWLGKPESEKAEQWILGVRKGEP